MFISWVKKRYHQIRKKYILRSSGFDTWDSYLKAVDKKISPSASDIQNYYSGYPYIQLFENRDHQIYRFDGLRLDGSVTIEQWCRQYCIKKYRIDCHRISKKTIVLADGTKDERWYFDEFSGDDIFIAAFEYDYDAVLFSLKWS